MIKKITFEIETITPMFLAGADQSKAELRVASIKGLLRFWWRALQAESSLDELRKKENRIFGSSDEKLGGGSSFAMRIEHMGNLSATKADLPKHNITVTSVSRGKTFPVNILEYLAFGPCSYDKTRDYIQHNFKFTIHIIIFKKEWLKEILQAMYVFELFGGIGSKSRNGFGSFLISNKQECFNSVDDRFANNDDRYSQTNLQIFINHTDVKSYTSFAEGTRVFRTRELYNTWDKALGEVGKIYRGIRSGDIKIANIEGKQTTFEKHFKYDKRQYIGAPIIVDEQDKSFLERHAKPYFIKIAKEGNQYRGYILYLPSRYCDGLEKGRADRPINHDDVNKNFTEFCTEFNNFLADNMKTVI